MVEGAYDLTTNGRKYRLKKDDVIYYHDGEDVLWEDAGQFVEFIPFGFFAPSFEPPPTDKRCFSSTPAMRAAFHEAAEIAESSEFTEGFRRDLLLFSCLFRILAELPWELGQAGQVALGAELWWEIERWLRSTHRYRITLKDICRHTGRSASTVSRSCRLATDLSPMNRIKALRMDAGRGMLMYTERNVSEVADYLGYPRIHEFSREFSQFYGQPPSSLQAN